MSIDLESILNQTFNDEYNRIASRPISNSEEKHINDIFININNITECLICCDDDKACIKCFQCTAYYCKGCLVKIASDFNKCSTCGVTIKDNYNKLKEYNQELQEQLEIEKAIANSLNSFIEKQDLRNPARKNEDLRNPARKNEDLRNPASKNEDLRNPSQTHISEDSDSDSENEQNKNKSTIKLKNKNNHVKINLKPSLMNKLNGNTNNDNYDQEPNKNNKLNQYYEYNKHIYSNKTTFIEDLREDKVYNIDFKSFINEISPNKPNYSYELNHNFKTITFYALCNQNKDFTNIIINYNILKSTFQSVLYIWLNEICKCSFNTFKIKWNSIATKINAMSLRNDNISNQEIKKFTKEIINICKN